jgi:hypothetical protein
LALVYFGNAETGVEMNSLYQIRSKMLHRTKVIILVEKKIEKEVAWLGFEQFSLKNSVC